MKKMICLLVIVLMIASVAFAAKKMMITPKDLAGLKGTWEGMLDFGVMGGTSASAPCKLELLNDAVPVKMKLTLLNVPDFVAQQLGITGGTNVVETIRPRRPSDFPRIDLADVRIIDFKS